MAIMFRPAIYKISFSLAYICVWVSNVIPYWFLVSSFLSFKYVLKYFFVQWAILKLSYFKKEVHNIFNNLKPYITQIKGLKLPLVEQN